MRHLQRISFHPQMEKWYLINKNTKNCQMPWKIINYLSTDKRNKQTVVFNIAGHRGGHVIGSDKI